MAKNRNTFEKHQREIEKKRKAEQKRERRRKKKVETEGTVADDISSANVTELTSSTTDTSRKTPIPKGS